MDKLSDIDIFFLKRRNLFSSVESIFCTKIVQVLWIISVDIVDKPVGEGI